MSNSNSRASGEFSLSSFLGFVSNNFVLIVIMTSFFFGGFFFGSLWKENKILKSTDQLAAPSNPSAPKAAGAPAEVTNLSLKGLVATGKKVGANEKDLQKCIEDGKMADVVTSDLAGGKKAGVSGTPGTVVMVNGKPAELISGALPYEQVKTVVDYYVNGGEIDATKQAKVAGTPALSDADHYKGKEGAKIVLIEYSDFECPFCKRFHATMNQIVDEYKNDIGWAYRDFPLIGLHNNAQKAAEAAECVASMKGNDAYWEYVELLFN